MARSRLVPAHPRLFTAAVTRSVRLSPSFQRVTIASVELGEFDWSGFDHWFRLFIPSGVAHQGSELTLPTVSGSSWYRSYLMIPKDRRPHCSNYTVADLRRTADGAELDIDVVLHWNASGAMAGRVAIWATTAPLGSPVGLMDQGLLFDAPVDATAVHLIADETGIPAIRGILSSLPSDTVGSALIEVPDAADRIELDAPAGMAITWVSRPSVHPVHAAHAAPGAAALAHLESRPAPDVTDYAFVVGESSLATRARRALHRAGMPKSRITFSGFWKAG